MRRSSALDQVHSVAAGRITVSEEHSVPIEAAAWFKAPMSRLVDGGIRDMGLVEMDDRSGRSGSDARGRQAVSNAEGANTS